MKTLGNTISCHGDNCVPLDAFLSVFPVSLRNLPHHAFHYAVNASSPPL